MAAINMNSVMKMAEKVMESPKYKKMVEEKTNEIGMRVTMSAASKFAWVLQHEIDSLGVSEGNGGYANGKLGPTAISALSNIDYAEPYKIGIYEYMIPIWFDGDLHRDSLDPYYYNGVDNIVALLNNGYKAGNAIYGIWSGHGDDNIWSLQQRAGAGFIQNAVRSFMGNYASDYGFCTIRVDDTYK